MFFICVMYYIVCITCTIFIVCIIRTIFNVCIMFLSTVRFSLLCLCPFTLPNAFTSLIASQGADVYNALDLSENETVFKDLQFGAGDGHLQYYIFNWKCGTIEPNEVGLVLV